MAKSKTKAVKSKPGKAAAKTPKAASKVERTNKRLTKAQVYQLLAEKTELSKQQIGKVFDALRDLIHEELTRPVPGEVVIPNGLLKIKRKEKEATPEKQGINPKTKQPITIAAKPRRYVLGVRALKNLKAMLPELK
jgi:nucleoid DNA-binding protein